jgi:hypothetical protein
MISLRDISYKFPALCTDGFQIAAAVEIEHLPAVGSTKFIRIFINVVLPAPVVPVNATISPD